MDYGFIWGAVVRFAPVLDPYGFQTSAVKRLAGVRLNDFWRLASRKEAVKTPSEACQPQFDTKKTGPDSAYDRRMRLLFLTRGRQ